MSHFQLNKEVAGGLLPVLRPALAYLSFGSKWLVLTGLFEKILCGSHRNDNLLPRKVIYR